MNEKKGTVSMVSIAAGVICIFCALRLLTYGVTLLNLLGAAAFIVMAVGSFLPKGTLSFPLTAIGAAIYLVYSLFRVLFVLFNFLTHFYLSPMNLLILVLQLLIHLVMILAVIVLLVMLLQDALPAMKSSAGKLKAFWFAPGILRVLLLAFNVLSVISYRFVGIFLPRYNWMELFLVAIAFFLLPMAAFGIGEAKTDDGVNQL